MNLGKFFRLFVFVLFLAIFLYIVLLNSIPVKVAFYKTSYTVPLYVVIFVSFVLGCLITYLYSLVGTLKNKYKIMSLNKKLSSLEEQVKESASKELKIDSKEEYLGNELDSSKVDSSENNSDQN